MKRMAQVQLQLGQLRTTVRKLTGKSNSPNPTSV